MGINVDLYERTAVRRDVGGVAINVAVALYAVADALQAIADGGVPTAAQIKEVREYAKHFQERFNDLSGWTD